MPFQENDQLEMTINLWTPKGIIDFKRFKWLNLKAVKHQKNSTSFDYVELNELQHKKAKEIGNYDLTRFCELEAMKNSWKDIQKLPNYMTVLSSMKRMFEPMFSIQRILWDDVGYMLFKIYLKGKQPGLIHSPKELGIDLEIKDKGDKVCNEIKKNGLLYDRKNYLQIRVEDTLVFYISKSK